MVRPDRRILTVAATAVALGANLPGCVDAEQLRVVAGEPAPSYAAATLAGDTLALEALRGHAVVLNVWATWCYPCREEMPALQELYEQYRDRGLRIVAVSIDHARANREIRAFVEEHGIEFTILHDPDAAVSRRYRTAGVPETFLIDGDGVLVHRWIGQFDPMAPAVLEMVEAVLAG